MKEEGHKAYLDECRDLDGFANSRRITLVESIVDSGLPLEFIHGHFLAL